MKELVILSGKGGTGKTPVTGALAALAGDLVLVDCDVDAADLHLITRPEMKERHDFIGGEKAEIDQEQCTACGICYENCRFEAISQSESPINPVLAGYSVDFLSCEGCAVCKYLCIDAAIDMKPVISGEWFYSETPFGPLVHGRLGIAEANSGKLVTMLRNTARKLAEERNRELIIVDGPPGIGCPTIASVTGSSYVLLVTEPTISAYHDLKRIAQLIRYFHIKAGICINKFDINKPLNREIENFAADQGFDILGKLCYDDSMTQAQMAGKTVMEFDSGNIKSQIELLWNNLRRRLEKSGQSRVPDSTINVENLGKDGV